MAKAKFTKSLPPVRVEEELHDHIKVQDNPSEWIRKACQDKMEMDKYQETQK